MQTISQNARLLQYLKTHRKGITQMEAFTKLGICRLSERIWEVTHGSWGPGGRYHLQKKVNIRHESEKVKTRYGYAWVTRYRLV